MSIDSLQHRRSSTDSLQRRSSIDPLEQYTIDYLTKLGEGGSAVTYAASDRTTGERLAAKVFDIGKPLSVERIRAECQLLEVVSGNKHICRVRAHGRHPDQKQRYVAFMERASGGELFDLLTETYDGPIPEHVVAPLAAQLADGVGHCHSLGVAHLDLKLDNLLLDEAGVLKIIDFGIAHAYPLLPDGTPDRSKRVRGCGGTKMYTAPEVLRGTPYDGLSADMWSLGICLFALLFGFFPLDEAQPKDWRYERLVAAQALGESSVTTILAWYPACSLYYKTPARVGTDARDLIDRLLRVDPLERPPVEEVQAHAFIVGAARLRCLPQVVSRNRSRPASP